MVQEHLDLLVRPSFGTSYTNETLLDLHITPGLGAIPIDESYFREITHWIREMQSNDKSAKTIKNNHSLIFSSMETAVNLK